MNAKAIRDVIILLVSLLFFLVFCAFQDGSWALLLPLFIISGFIYYTKEDKSLASIRLRNWMIAPIIVAVLLFGIINGIVYRETFQTADVIRKLGLSDSRGVFSIIMVGLATMSLPWLMYTLSWVNENSENSMLKKVHTALTSRYFFWLCILFSCGIIAEMLYFTTSPAIMADDSLTWEQIKWPYDKMMEFIVRDCHPPFYYIVTKFISDTVHHLFPEISIASVAKIISVLPYIIFLIISATWVRRNWGNNAAGLVAITTCCMPSLLEYGVIIRMYSWTSLIVACSYIQGYRVMQKDSVKRWLLLVLINLAAVYTHYWAGVMVSVIFLYVGVWSLRQGRHTFMRWCLAAFISIIGYIPWLTKFIRQLTVMSSSTRFSEVDPLNIVFIVMQHCKTILLLFVIVICIAVLIHKIWNKSIHRMRESYILLGAGLPALILCVGTMMGLIFSLMVIDRYLVPALATMWIGTCIAISYISNIRLNIIATCVFVFFSINHACTFARIESGNAQNTEKFIANFGKTDSAVFITNELDHLFTVANLSNAPLYSYTPSISIYKWAVDVNGGERIYDIINNDQIKDIALTGKTVYIIFHNEEEARQFEKETDIMLEKEGVYDVRWYTWHIYRVNFPNK